MKLLTLLLAAIGLSGCVAYGGGAYTSDVYYGNPGVYPSYGTVYPAYGAVYPSTGTVYYGSTHVPRGYRDRDGDGVPNRYDRDRDGDGVPNRHDRDPRNPRIW